MQVKKFVGTDRAKIYKKILSEFGSDAVWLWEGVSKKSLLGILKKKRYEVLVGRGFKIIPQKRPKEARSTAWILEKLYGVKQPQKENTLEPLLRDVSELKVMLGELRQRLLHKKLLGAPPQLFEEYLLLLENLVSEEIAERLINSVQSALGEKIQNPALVRDALRGALMELIACSDGVDLKDASSCRIAFIGPTGVGKTTTIAKLAAIYKYKYRKSVGIITNDTYRIAATVQIAKIAERLDIPIRIAPLPEEIKDALRDFASKELILIDTAGRSQRNTKRMDELRQVIMASRPDEIHLVLSLTDHPERLKEVIKKFSVYNFSKIILTKLDEAVKFGVILEVLSKVDAKLSFITTGQEIPKDIEIADPERLAKLILGEEKIDIQ